MDDETKRKLRLMRLNSFIEAIEPQESDRMYEQMPFNDRLKLVVDDVFAQRQSKRLTRLIKQATFTKNSPSINEVDYAPDRKIKREQIITLASGTYIQEHHDLIIMGASGNGKTWLATALGIQACRQFHQVKYIRLPELIDDLLVAKQEANGDFRKLLRQYKKFELLIIDEWLLTELNENEANIILELVESRSQRQSTIYCSQINFKGWYSKLGNQQIADAILN